MLIEAATRNSTRQLLIGKNEMNRKYRKIHENIFYWKFSNMQIELQYVNCCKGQKSAIIAIWALWVKREPILAFLLAFLL